MTVLFSPDREPQKIFIHVGAHKTGTTLIQSYLHQFFNNNLYFYLDPEVINNSGLLGYLYGLESKPVNLINLARKSGLSQDATLIVSHESLLGNSGLQQIGGNSYFYGIFRKSAKRLRLLLPEADIHVIFYIRRQDEFLESMYLELLATVNTDYTFNKFISIQEPTRLSWLRVITDLEDVFGADHVQVALFDDIRSGAPTFIANFMRRIGITVSPDTIPDLGKQRPSLSRGAYYLANMAMRSGMPIKYRRKLNDFLRSRWTNKTHKSANLLSCEHRYGLLSSCKPDNSVLFNKYFPDLDIALWHS